VLDVKRLDKELALRVRLDYGEKSKMALGTAKVGVHNSTGHCRGMHPARLVSARYYAIMARSLA
jgi:hypothetical protein